MKAVAVCEGSNGRAWAAHEKGGALDVITPSRDDTDETLEREDLVAVCTLDGGIRFGQHLDGLLSGFTENRRFCRVSPLQRRLSVATATLGERMWCAGPMDRADLRGRVGL